MTLSCSLCLCSRHQAPRARCSIAWPLSLPVSAWAQPAGWPGRSIDLGLPSNWPQYFSLEKKERHSPSCNQQYDAPPAVLLSGRSISPMHPPYVISWDGALPSIWEGTCLLKSASGKSGNVYWPSQQVTMFQPLQELSRAQSLRLETPLWTDVGLEDTSVLLQLTAYLSMICTLPIPGAWAFGFGDHSLWWNQ